MNFVHPAQITPSVRVVIFGPASAAVAAYLERGFLVPGPQGGAPPDAVHYTQQSDAITAALRSPMTADEAERSAGLAVDPRVLEHFAAPRARLRNPQAWHVPVAAATAAMVVELGAAGAEYMFAIRSSDVAGMRPIANDGWISYAVAVVPDPHPADTAQLAALFPRARWIKPFDGIIPGEDFAPRPPVFADTRGLLFARGVLMEYSGDGMDGLAPRLLMSREEVADLLARCGLDSRDVPAAARAALRTAAYAEVLRDGAVVTNVAWFVANLTDIFAQAGRFLGPVRRDGAAPELRTWRTRWGDEIGDEEASALFHVAANMPESVVDAWVVTAHLRAFGFVEPAPGPALAAGILATYAPAA